MRAMCRRFCNKKGVQLEALKVVSRFLDRVI
jgi:hypothetical protein